MIMISFKLIHFTDIPTYIATIYTPEKNHVHQINQMMSCERTRFTQHHMIERIRKGQDVQTAVMISLFQVSCNFGNRCSIVRTWVRNNVFAQFTLSEYLHDHFWNVLGIPVCQNRPHRGSGRRSRFLQLHGVPGLQRAPEPPASHQGWIHPLNFLIRVGLGYTS